MTDNRQRSLSGAFWLVLALAALLTAACREKEWDPSVALLVNGRPVPRSAVDQVLEWGSYPSLGLGGEIEGAESLPMIIDKLIDEQLILAEAEKAGLTVTRAEVDEAAAALGTAWFGVQPPPAELDDLRRALRNHLLIHKMTGRIMVERRVLSAAQWRVFWDQWPQSREPRYLVRVLLLPGSDEPPELPEEKGLTLSGLAGALEKRGLPVVLSEPFWLAGDSLAEGERQMLAGLGRGRFSPPARLKESWAIYEVTDVDRGPDREEEFKKARAAFEERAGEEAFLNWLADLKARAKIELNPALAEMLARDETAG